ncbi:hypothetical protein [Tsukamurella sp. PLM1]|uniref:hypothetical protein n=1 Tax=Tsukamurella sp. PLM1 TaxID=2929795 RepID=UPI0020C0141B|nr:hypothetical protein [Tsukamurella sp. PLM1]
MHGLRVLAPGRRSRASSAARAAFSMACDAALMAEDAIRPAEAATAEKSAR